MESVQGGWLGGLHSTLPYDRRTAHRANRCPAVPALLPRRPAAPPPRCPLAACVPAADGQTHTHTQTRQAVPECAGSFASRKALPQPWRGVRDEALSEVSGIPGGTFVHAAGFIGGNQTKEGALAMAAAGLAFEG